MGSGVGGVGQLSSTQINAYVVENLTIYLKNIHGGRFWLNRGGAWQVQAMLIVQWVLLLVAPPFPMDPTSGSTKTYA